MPPPMRPSPPVDLNRPECRDLYERKRELEAELRRWAERLRNTRNPAERARIIQVMDRLEFSIQELDDQLFASECYVTQPPTPVSMIRVTSLELTQSTQFHPDFGSGAGRANSIPLVAHKPLLVRAYVENMFHQSVRLTGRLRLHAWNPVTLSHDIFRRDIEPLVPLDLSPTEKSDRRHLDRTLNFLVPDHVCVERLRLDAQVWVEGHAGEGSYSGSNWEDAVFNTRRVPIIHCFRINLTRTFPSSTPTPYAPPSDAACRRTVELAESMFPVQDLDVRDRGTRAYSGPLGTVDEYDAVRVDIQTVREGTTPTPAEHEIYVAMLPEHGNASVWGQALDGSIQTTVGRRDLFAHELGHLLLPGDDHVEDSACLVAGVTLEQVDPNYPDYANAVRQSGTGEWGADLGAAPVELFSPETSDIMSYCRGDKWISPYNYARAFHGDLLNPYDDRMATRASGDKMLLLVRVHREGKAELRWALHLPGAPRTPSAKSQTNVVIELHDAKGALVASTPCHRAADRADTAPYEDYLESLPWFEAVASVVIVRDGRELARWAVEDAPQRRLVNQLHVEERARAGGGTNLRISWDRPEDAQPVHQMLRYSPDGGNTWIPLANAIAGDSLEVAPETLGDAANLRFQLAVSTGFRTTLVESEELPNRSGGGPCARILQPEPGATYRHKEMVRLVGTHSSCQNTGDLAAHAYWSSNRDGFLAEGLRARVDGLSPGRHILRLVIDDGASEELSARVAIRVE